MTDYIARIAPRLARDRLHRLARPMTATERGAAGVLNGIAYDAQHDRLFVKVLAEALRRSGSSPDKLLRRLLIRFALLRPTHGPASDPDCRRYRRHGRRTWPPSASPVNVARLNTPQREPSSEH
jgi:hypothetical protein